VHAVIAAVAALAPARGSAPVAALLVALVAACGTSGPDVCTITCGPSAACPTDSVCGADGYCHPGDTVDPADLCDVAGTDGSTTPRADADPDRPDADPDRTDADPDDPDPDAAPGDPDAGPTDPVDCDVYFQTGCPDGMACELGGGGTFCRDVEPPGPDGDACDSIVECAAGDTCDGLVGICRHYCEDSGDCLRGPGDACTVEMSSGAVTCTADCTPVTNAGCPPGWGCVIYEIVGSVIVTDCVPGGAGTQGATCDSSIFDCAPGFGCYTEDGVTSTCYGICRVGVDPCPGGTTCLRFGPPEAYLDGVEYGLCG
jgi:hypothetical protein